MTIQPFQFAVLRYIHDPVTEEFLNIGVVVYSKENRYLQGKISKRYGRVSQTFGGIQRTHYNRMTSAIVRRTAQLRRKLSKPSLFDDYADRIEELLGEILPPDPSSLKFGGFGGGLTDDLDAELERLYERLVTRYEQTDEPESRTDEDVWHSYSQVLKERGLLDYLEATNIETPTFDYRFDHAYKNNKWHALEPVSLDLVHVTSIHSKVSRWIGNVLILDDADQLGSLNILLGTPRNPSFAEDYEDARYVLKSKTRSVKKFEVNVVGEDEAESFVNRFAQKIKAHQPA